jgi:hypothetical protein
MIHKGLHGRNLSSNIGGGGGGAKLTMGIKKLYIYIYPSPPLSLQIHRR